MKTSITFMDYSMIYAYIRINSSEQNAARQEMAIQNSGYKVKTVFTDIAGGKDTHRPYLQQLLSILVSGDTLIVHSIDRLCRNMMDMCNLTLDLKQRGVSLIFLKENICFSAHENNPLQELQLHMMSAFSQFERALIRERQAEGIAAKKHRGEQTGRPPADKRKVAMVDELKAKGIRLKIACDNVGIGVSTYYKLRKR
ncbi:recombinase family protein [Photorhabdus sp. CRCIA-P01]|uniref:recombinase family protein n=1 Tax=Photorhabdus sp. CRCIA-P01 TaxID=2019570 RepID=UPI001E2E1538|nr:recombinase family protein [Photorhabdus sp. CRCIA-P01]